MNRSYSQNAPFDKIKTRHRFGPSWGSIKGLYFPFGIHISQKPLNLGLDPGLDLIELMEGALLVWSELAKGFARESWR